METSVSFFLFCQLKPLLPSALGGGLGRPRRSGIPSPEGERRMSNSHLKVLHFDLESSPHPRHRFLTLRTQRAHRVEPAASHAKRKGRRDFRANNLNNLPGGQVLGRLNRIFFSLLAVLLLFGKADFPALRFELFVIFSRDIKKVLRRRAGARCFVSVC